MLLESQLAIKDIAQELGYARNGAVQNTHEGVSLVVMDESVRDSGRQRMTTTPEEFAETLKAHRIGTHGAVTRETPGSGSTRKAYRPDPLERGQPSR